MRALRSGGLARLPGVRGGDNGALAGSKMIRIVMLAAVIVSTQTIQGATAMNDVGKWSQSECEKILGFLGYGSSSASIWFVGQEEGLGGKMSELDDEAGRNLRARGKWENLMDLHEAHLTLTEQGMPIDITKPRRGSSTVWLWMSRIARAYEGFTDWRDREKAREYMRSRLGRSTGDTFMTELSPVPKRNLGDKSWLRELSSQHGAGDMLIQRRKELRAPRKIALTSDRGQPWSERK
jgi:hypothetical protein